MSAAVSTFQCTELKISTRLSGNQRFLDVWYAQLTESDWLFSNWSRNKILTILYAVSFHFDAKLHFENVYIHIFKRLMTIRVRISHQLTPRKAKKTPLNLCELYWNGCRYNNSILIVSVKILIKFWNAGFNVIIKIEKSKKRQNIAHKIRYVCLLRRLKMHRNSLALFLLIQDRWERI